MNISDLATRPELQQLTLDSEAIVEAYGEPITFWMRDHLDLATYFDFYKFQKESSGEQLMSTLRKIVLTAEGKPAIPDDCILPVDVTLEIMVKINDNLGKSKTRLSKKEVGTQP